MPIQSLIIFHIAIVIVAIWHMGLFFCLICFAVGFLLNAISFIAGGLRWHLHLPHFPHGGGKK